MFEYWTDAHLHLQDPRFGDVAVVVEAMRREGVMRGVVNGTCEEDWDAVESVTAAAGIGFLPAYGIHPWRAERLAEGWLERLARRLQNDSRASVGEIGVDGWVSGPSMEVQREVLKAQWNLARDMGRPVTLHALKAWDPLFEVLDASPPQIPFLMHSFAGSLEIANRLVAMGAYFSFSGYFLHARKAKVLEVFRRLPRERILIESDAPDMRPPAEWVTHSLGDMTNHPANLPAVGAGMADGLGMSVDALACLTRVNAERCFGLWS